MEIINVIGSTIEDLKQLLKDGGFTSTTLRIYLKVG